MGAAGRHAEPQKAGPGPELNHPAPPHEAAEAPAPRALWGVGQALQESDQRPAAFPHDMPGGGRHGVPRVEEARVHEVLPPLQVPPADHHGALAPRQADLDIYEAAPTPSSAPGPPARGGLFHPGRPALPGRPAPPLALRAAGGGEPRAAEAEATRRICINICGRGRAPAGPVTR